MRKRTEITIEGYEKKFEIKELTVKEIMELFDKEALSDNSIDGFIGVVDGKLLAKCGNFTLDELKVMTPSEIKILWEKFKMVNEVFFRDGPGIGPSRNHPGDQNESDGGLWENVCRLIQSGHLNVIDYGYSYYLRAVYQYQLINLEEEKRISRAFRAARFMGSRKYTGYLKEKIKKPKVLKERKEESDIKMMLETGIIKPVKPPKGKR